MNFVRKSLNSLVKLQQMFRIAEIELGMENTIGITLETGVGVQSAILHVCPNCIQCNRTRRVPSLKLICNLTLAHTVVYILQLDQ